MKLPRKRPQCAHINSNTNKADYTWNRSLASVRVPSSLKVGNDCARSVSMECNTITQQREQNHMNSLIHYLNVDILLCNLSMYTKLELNWKLNPSPTSVRGNLLLVQQVYFLNTCSPRISTRNRPSRFEEMQATHFLRSASSSLYRLSFYLHQYPPSHYQKLITRKHELMKIGMLHCFDLDWLISPKMHAIVLSQAVSKNREGGIDTIDRLRFNPLRNSFGVPRQRYLLQSQYFATCKEGGHGI